MDALNLMCAGRSRHMLCFLCRQPGRNLHEAVLPGRVVTLIAGLDIQTHTIRWVCAVCALGAPAGS